MDWNRVSDEGPLLVLLLGGLIAFLCLYYYYVKASKDLIKETETLHKYNNIILTFREVVSVPKQMNIKLEEIELARDKKGNIEGWKINRNLVLPAKAGISFEAIVVHPPENKEKQEKPK